MESYLLWVILLGLAVGLSAFFSGMEAGLFALNPVRIRTWVRQERKGARQLHAYLQDPEGFLWTVVVGNTLANCLAVVITVLLLPKRIFQTYPNRLCLLMVRPFRLVHRLLAPLVGLMRFAARLVTPRDAIQQGYRLVSSLEEFRLTLQESPEGLSRDERQMIGRVLDLRGVKVGELATPLAKLVSVDTETPLGEVLSLARQRRVTRFPVWEGKGRKGREPRVVGVISLKTLLYQDQLNLGRPAAEFLKPALYLPEESQADEALQRMRRSGHRLAIVLGSRGKEVGVVTRDDILRYLFGEVKV
ncbi:MAG: Mg2 and Co2 transporter [Verrucomicrobiota bacterium]